MKKSTTLILALTGLIAVLSQSTVDTQARERPITLVTKKGVVTTAQSLLDSLLCYKDSLDILRCTSVKKLRKLKRVSKELKYNDSVLTNLNVINYDIPIRWSQFKK